MLVKTKREMAQKTTGLPIGNHRYGRFASCNQMMEGSHHVFPDVSITLNLNFFANCLSSFAMYLIMCSCSKKYIGSSVGQIHTKMAEHRSRIWNNVIEAPLVQHFFEYNNAPNGFKFFIVEVISTKKTSEFDLRPFLLLREGFWTFKF